MHRTTRIPTLALTFVVTIAACAVVVLSDSASAATRPAAAVQLSATQPPMQDVVIYLRSRADLAGPRPTNRRDRLAQLENNLRSHAERTQRPILNLLTRGQSEHLVSAVQALWVTNAIAVSAVPGVIRELASRPDVERVEPDVTIAATESAVQPIGGNGAIEPNITLVKAPALWDKGFQGQNVVLASMDTGVDVTHPDLAATWRGGTNSWFDPNAQHSTPTDVSGHGTQTMGVMVGRGSGGTSIGMAPQAKWIAVKIFNDRGLTTTSTIHRGFQWLLDPDGNPGTADAPNVVNSSWTLSSTGCNLDFQSDLQALRTAGILPVFAAGNAGPAAGTAMSPGNNPEAFAVGATDNSDGLYPNSSRGPSPCTGQAAPSIVAPGTNIRTDDLFGGYVADTGTSVAAPHVSGALALLLSALPELTPDRQAAALTAAATDLGSVGTDNDTGSGRLDTLAAYQWLTSAGDFGISASPGTVTVPAGGTATYDVTSTASNGFSGDIALSVNGLPAQATAAFAPSTLTVGGGTARLTVNTSLGVSPGEYLLSIDGTSGSLHRTTTVSLVVQGPPDYELNVSPASQTVSPGSTATYQVVVSSIRGFTGDVALSVTGTTAPGSTSIAPSVISTAGTAQLTVITQSDAAAGDYSFTISGTSSGASHSSTISLTVLPPPDYAITATPSIRTVSAGQQAVYSVGMTPSNGFVAPVTLIVAGLPSSVGVAAISPGSVTGTTTAQLTISTVGSAPVGSYPINVIGTSGAFSHTTTVTLTVTKADFTMTASPSTQTVNRGQTATYQLVLGSVGGFSGSVKITTSGPPAGSTVTITPTQVTVPGTSTVRITTNSRTKRGTFSVVITAKTATTTHVATVSVTVN